MAKRGSEEWKNNIKGARLGSIPWNKGLKGAQRGWNKGSHMSEESKRKLSQSLRGRVPWNKGKRYKSPNISDALKGKRNYSISGDKHYAWVGNNIGYKGLHSWINKQFGKPTICEHCGANKNMEWANKTGKLLRDRENWLQLCKSCHNRYDGIVNNIYQTKGKQNNAAQNR